MGSGREASPSPAVAAMESNGGAGKSAASKSPSARYKLQREELLGGSSPRILDPYNGLLRSNTSPRLQAAAAPNSTKRQPGAKKGATTLPSPKLPVSFDPAHSQESILKGSPLQTIPPPDAAERQDDGPFANSNRSKSNIPDGRLAPRKLKLEVVPFGKERLALPHNWTPETLQVAQQNGFPISPDWTVRGAMAGCLDFQEMKECTDDATLCPSLKPSKNSCRRTTMQVEKAEEQDLHTVERSKASRGSRSHSRRQKRKASDSDPDLALALAPPDSSFPSQERVALLQPCKVDQSYSRREMRERRSEYSERADWLQVVVDIVLWRHVPRSSLLFGMGCFCILSASLMHDLEYSIISIMAYIAFFYLAVVFLRRTFGSRATSEFSTIPSVCQINEADASKIIKLVLPAINMMLIKFSEVFSGEPAMTLKVAAILWFLTQAGSIMRFWTLVRVAYFCLFLIPKCYSCYRVQLHAYAQNMLLWGWATWDACSHKKAVLVAAIFIAWNFSSISSRICGAFTFIVAFRVYHHSVKPHEANQNMMNFQTFSVPISAASHGLQLISLPQPGQQNNQFFYPVQPLQPPCGFRMD